MATVPLPLKTVRKEQRRVAALLQKEHSIRTVKRPRKSLLPPQHVCMCSHLNPEGKNTNPAWNFHKEGLLNVQRTRNIGLRVAASEEYGEYVGRECCNGSERLHSHSDESKHDHGKQSPTKKRKSDGYFSRSFDGALQRKDIEEFRYSSLRKSDSTLSRFSLPNLRSKGRKSGPGHAFPKGRSFLMHVPDNTPIPTADPAGRRRVDRSFVLPPVVKENGGADPSLQYKHGVVSSQQGQDESYEEFLNRWDPDKGEQKVDTSSGAAINGKLRYPPRQQVCRCASPQTQNAPFSEQTSQSLPITDSEKERQKDRRSKHQYGPNGTGFCEECEKDDGSHAAWCTVDMYSSLRRAARDDTLESVISTCGRCGLQVEPLAEKNKAVMATGATNQSNRTSRGAVIESKTSGIYTMSRNNTLNSSSSFVSNKEKTESEYSFRYGTEPTVSDIQLTKSKTELSIQGEQLLEEGSFIQQQSRDGAPSSRGVKQRKSRGSREKIQNGAKEKSSHKRVTQLSQNIEEHSMLEGIDIYGKGSHSIADHPYAEKLNDLDLKLKEGAFDFDTEVDINDVDTTLRMPTDVEEQKERELAAVLQRTAAKDPKAFASLTSNSSRVQIFKDGTREAYVKALAARQIQNLPKDYWDFSRRITPAFSFSYYRVIPDNCPDCDKPVVQAPVRNPVKGKGKRAEMKHIFGHIDVNDYYPGGKKNPLETRNVS